MLEDKADEAASEILAESQRKCHFSANTAIMVKAKRALQLHLYQIRFTNLYRKTK